MRNGLLAAASIALFLGALELGSRLLGLGPMPEVAAYIADWERQWDGDFYTLAPRANVNREGLRDFELAEGRTPGVQRLAFLGDSVTFGYQLPKEVSYPVLLQRAWKRRGRDVEVMNVALPGWSTRQQRIAYERIVRRYRPDHVLVGFCLNDVAEMQNNLARPNAVLSALFRHSHLVRALLRPEAWEIERVEELFLYPDSQKVSQAWDRTLEELDELARQVTQDGARFSVVVLPFRFQVVGGAPEPVAQRRLERWATERGFGFVDVLPELESIGPKAFIDYDHLSPTGARVVAQRLATDEQLLAEPSSAGPPKVRSSGEALGPEAPGPS